MLTPGVALELQGQSSDRGGIQRSTRIGAATDEKQMMRKSKNEHCGTVALILEDTWLLHDASRIIFSRNPSSRHVCRCSSPSFVAADTGIEKIHSATPLMVHDLKAIDR